eukprot:TRINITY_DN34685_c0_g1_i1.p1 TRINITY_DN34685_c0_g1~~TRINITY_DN34685_c0_g1_i1.p1  ORF type:complete len:475 (-),score=75.33 TRINITY_DN34685_c0_g1_i1:154-1548(-)
MLPWQPQKVVLLVGLLICQDVLLARSQNQDSETGSAAGCNEPAQGASSTSKPAEGGDERTQLFIAPRWTSFDAFEQPKGSISGSLTVEYEWSWPSGEQYLHGKLGDEEPYTVVDLVNFASGSSDRVASGTFNDGRRGCREYRKKSVIYVGSFHQSVDGTCYPWDTQTVTFEFKIQSPFDVNMNLLLQCPGGDTDCSPPFERGNRNRNGTWIKNTKWENQVSKNYVWSVFECEKTASSTVMCEMKGTRSFTKTVPLQILPGIMMCIIGFSTFVLPPSMAMPRVSATMIALLTFVTKGTSVTASLPSQGLSIFEEFYIIGVITMSLNVMGHIASWKIPKVANLIAELQLGFTLCLFLLIMSVMMHARQCENVSAELTLSCIVISAVMLVVSTALSLKRHWKDLVSLIAKAESKAETTARMLGYASDKDEEEAECIGAGMTTLPSSAVPDAEEGQTRVPVTPNARST